VSGSGKPAPPLGEEQRERVAIWGDLDASPVAALEQTNRPAASRRQRGRAERWTALVKRVLLLFLAVWLFLLALAVMKGGARGLAPALGPAIDTAWNGLGLGWLGALVVLSGSPVAASALALFAGGSLTADESYAMVVGSRLGASFVVLVIGALYAVRDRDSGPRAPISIGVLALAMTAVAYVPGSLLGLLLLQSGIWDGVMLTPPAFVFDATRALTKPAVDAIELVLPATDVLRSGMLFVLGVAILLSSFKTADAILPVMSGSDREERARWYVGPWAMFGLGFLVALATLSVSVALGILVPVVAKGYVRREQILPYIAGANISTLADTLLAALLLENQVAPRIVLSLGLGVAAWTVAILFLGYPTLRRLIFAFQSSVLRTRTRLVTFVCLLFACPVALFAIK
jgi:hypothetical protein